MATDSKMEWKEILLLILANAPAIIQTVEEALTWAMETWVKIKASYDADPSSITPELLLASLDRIKANSAEIQAIT